MARNFNDLFIYLDSLGVLDSFLPFFLVFIITFAILEKVKILGEGKKNMNVALALLFGLAVVIPHLSGWYPPQADVVDIINTSLPQVSAVLVGIVCVLLLIGVFAPNIRWTGGSPGGILILLALAIVIFIFGNSAGWWYSPSWAYWLDDDTASLILILLFFAIVVAFIVQDDSGERRTMSWVGELGNMFGGGGRGGH